MRLVLVGPTDSGKTTLAWALARRTAEKRGRAYLLDLDVGQGSLPGTVARFRLEGEEVLEEERLLVGRVSPVGAEGWLLAASARLARGARGPFVADTDGFAKGPRAERLRYQQVEALGAGEVAVLDGALMAAFAWREDLRVRRVPPPPGVREKTPAERLFRRTARLLAHFRGARFRALPRPPGDPRYLFALLDGRGRFLGYAALVVERGERGLFWTPVADRVTRVVPTWVRVPGVLIPDPATASSGAG